MHTQWDVIDDSIYTRKTYRLLVCFFKINFLDWKSAARVFLLSRIQRAGRISGPLHHRWEFYPIFLMQSSMYLIFCRMSSLVIISSFAVVPSAMLAKMHSVWKRTKGGRSGKFWSPQTQAPSRTWAISHLQYMFPILTCSPLNALISYPLTSLPKKVTTPKESLP